MDDQSQEHLQLDYNSARGLSPKRAAFFHRGRSQAVADGVVFFPTQGNCTAFLCGDRVLLVDTTPQWYVQRTLEDLRANYSEAPVDTIVYTHGHIDHVTGAEAIRAEAAAQGHARPRIIGHRDVAQRFDRYQLMHEQNNFINRVQFNLPEHVRAFSTLPSTYPHTTYNQ